MALEKGKTSYTDNLGLIRLRQEINRYVERHFGLSYHPEKEILVTVGVSEALDIALRAGLNPGDKVLVPRAVLRLLQSEHCLGTRSAHRC